MKKSIKIFADYWSIEPKAMEQFKSAMAEGFEQSLARLPEVENLRNKDKL